MAEEIDAAKFIEDFEERKKRCQQEAEQIVDSAFTFEIRRPNKALNVKLDGVMFVWPWTTRCGKPRGINVQVLSAASHIGSFSFSFPVSKKETFYVNGAQVSANDILNRKYMVRKELVQYVFLESDCRAQKERGDHAKPFIFALALAALFSVLVVLSWRIGYI